MGRPVLKANKNTSPLETLNQMPRALNSTNKLENDRKKEEPEGLTKAKAKKDRTAEKREAF